jgi:hypothetical protein
MMVQSFLLNVEGCNAADSWGIRFACVSVLAGACEVQFAISFSTSFRWYRVTLQLNRMGVSKPARS